MKTREDNTGAQLSFLSELVGLPAVFRGVQHLMRFWKNGEFNESVSYSKWLEYYAGLSRDGGGQ